WVEPDVTRKPRRLHCLRVTPRPTATSGIVARQPVNGGPRQAEPSGPDMGPTWVLTWVGELACPPGPDRAYGRVEVVPGVVAPVSVVFALGLVPGEQHGDRARDAGPLAVGDPAPPQAVDVEGVDGPAVHDL